MQSALLPCGQGASSPEASGILRKSELTFSKQPLANRLVGEEFEALGSSCKPRISWHWGGCPEGNGPFPRCLDPGEAPLQEGCFSAPRQLERSSGSEPSRNRIRLPGNGEADGPRPFMENFRTNIKGIERGGSGAGQEAAVAEKQSREETEQVSGWQPGRNKSRGEVANPSRLKNTFACGQF